MSPRPELGQRVVVDEDLRRIGKERTIPESATAAVEQLDLPLQIKGQRRCTFIAAVDHDHVVAVHLRLDGVGENLRRERGRERVQRQVRRDEKRGDGTDEEAVRHAGFLFEPEPQIGGEADENSGCCDTERHAKCSQRAPRQVEEVSEKESVSARDLLQHLRDIGANRQGLVVNREDQRRDGGEEADDEKNPGNNLPCR